MYQDNPNITVTHTVRYVMVQAGRIEWCAKVLDTESEHGAADLEIAKMQAELIAVALNSTCECPHELFPVGGCKCACHVAASRRMKGVV